MCLQCKLLQQDAQSASLSGLYFYSGALLRCLHYPPALLPALQLSLSLTGQFSSCLSNNHSRWIHSALIGQPLRNKSFSNIVIHVWTFIYSEISKPPMATTHRPAEAVCRHVWTIWHQFVPWPSPCWLFESEYNEWAVDLTENSKTLCMLIHNDLSITR